MPNYYAHQVFGALVLPKLAPALRARVEGELGAFQAGLYGPDPLFFYHPLTPSTPRSVGIALHHTPVRVPARTLLRQVEQRRPFALGYAAGFLCHCALDSACHPLVDEYVAAGMPHAGMEGELDRLLMCADGHDPLKEAPLPRWDLPWAFFDTAAELYPGVTAKQLEKSLRAFRRVCRAQARAAGTVLGRGLDRISRCRGLSALRGAVLTRRPDPLCARAAEELRAILEAQAPPTAQRLDSFFRGDELDSWYDLDLHGRPHPVPAMV